MTPDERDQAVLERFKQTIVELTGVMDVLAHYLQLAMVPILQDAGARRKAPEG